MTEKYRNCPFFLLAAKLEFLSCLLSAAPMVVTRSQSVAHLRSVVECFPEELWIEVLSNLRGKDLGRIACVCKSFAGLREQVWKGACRKRWPAWFHLAQAPETQWRRQYELLELRERERAAVPNVATIHKLQRVVNSRHRTVLTEWLAEVGAVFPVRRCKWWERFNLGPTFQVAPPAGILGLEPGLHYRIQGGQLPRSLPQRQHGGRPEQVSAHSTSGGTMQALAVWARACSHSLLRVSSLSECPLRHRQAPSGLSWARRQYGRLHMQSRWGDIKCAVILLAGGPDGYNFVDTDSKSWCRAPRQAKCMLSGVQLLTLPILFPIRFQLVGIACLRAAMSDNKVRLPYKENDKDLDPHRFAYISDRTYTPQQVEELTTVVHQGTGAHVRLAPNAKMFLRSFWYRAVTAGLLDAEEMHLYTLARSVFRSLPVLTGLTTNAWDESQLTVCTPRAASFCSWACWTRRALPSRPPSWRPLPCPLP